MQRNRHDARRHPPADPAGARHPAAHGGCEIEPVAIFEGMHQRAGDVVIAHGGAGAADRRADRRSPASTGCRGRDRRRRECRAARRRAARWARASTSRRRTGRRSADHIAAGRAERRQRDIERQPQRRAQRPREAPRAWRARVPLLSRRRHGITLSPRRSTVYQCLITLSCSIAICCALRARAARARARRRDVSARSCRDDLAERLSVVLRQIRGRGRYRHAGRRGPQSSGRSANSRRA